MAPTPLRAALQQRIEITQLLIKHGANVKLRDTGRITVLHLAVMSGRVDIIRELLQHGADVNAKDITGETPLAIALKDYFLKLDVITVLMQNGASLCKMADWDSPHSLQGWSRINDMLSISSKGFLLLGILREFYVKPKVGDSENEWLESMQDLHLACLQVEGDRDVILKTLLDMDIDFNARDVAGLTALEYAAIGGTKKTLTKLLQKGVDIRCIDQYGATLLHRAVIAERIDLIELLLAEGEDVNVKISLSSAQATALVAADLLDHVFEVYAAKCQLTPLQLAILGNRRKSASVLLQHKASLEPFAFPRMPIQFPAARHGMDFYQQLIDAGASTSLDDVSIAAASSLSLGIDGAFAILKTYVDPLRGGSKPSAYLEGVDQAERRILSFSGEVETMYVKKVFFCPLVMSGATTS